MHRGLVYLDTAQDDVYGLGANLAARICSLAHPGEVTASMAIERVVRDKFDFEARPPQRVKGVEGQVVYYRVAGEHEAGGKIRGPLVGREEELARLQSLWAQAAACTLPKPGVVLRGEGGIGKSRLVREVTELAAERGFEVFSAYCEGHTAQVRWSSNCSARRSTPTSACGQYVDCSNAGAEFGEGRMPKRACASSRPRSAGCRWTPRLRSH